MAQTDSIGHKQQALSTSEAVIVAASSAPSRVKIKNTHATILVYVGKAGVTTSNGYLLGPGSELTLDFPHNTPAISAIAASGTPSVSVLRIA